MANPRIEPLKKVLAIDPNDEVAWFGLGKAYMDDGNFVEAVTALESCIRVNRLTPLPTMRWLNLSRSSIGSTVAVKSSIRASPSQLRMEMRWSLKIWNCSKQTLTLTPRLQNFGKPIISERRMTSCDVDELYRKRFP